MTTAKISPFPRTLNPQRETDRETQSNSVTDSLTNYTRARARDADLADIGAYYCETFGAAALPPVAKILIERVLDDGMSPDLVYEALDEAAMVRRPSWAYAAAILRRLSAEGCYTIEAYHDRQRRWRARRGYGDDLL